MATIGDISGELREDIPLKKGTRDSKWFCFSKDCIGGSRFINFCLGIFTVIITAALLLQIYYGDYQVVPHGSVASDNKECSEIGTSILKIGGNAIDAAIASAFCLAVVNPHTTSLDAQGQIMIYSHKQRQSPTVIDFSDMQWESNLLPRLVTGLMYTHQHFGHLSWKDLIQPSVELAKNGFLVSNQLAISIARAQVQNLFGPLEAGHIAQFKILSETLQKIADFQEKEIYNKISLNNTPKQSLALKSTFNEYNVYVPSNPNIGPILLLNLQHIESINTTVATAKNPEIITSIAEIIQAVYQMVNITSEFHEGTNSNVAVMDTEDQYVSLVTGLYGPFGSGKMTSGGYLLDVPPQNKLSCSRIPIIITDSEFICGRRLVFGVENVATAVQLLNYLLTGSENATEGIESPRFSILSRDSIGLEESHKPLFTDETVQHLEKLWHLYPLNEPYSSINIVEKINDFMSSHSDSRGGGISSRF